MFNTDQHIGQSKLMALTNDFQPENIPKIYSNRHNFFSYRLMIDNNPGYLTLLFLGVIGFETAVHNVVPWRNMLP